MSDSQNKTMTRREALKRGAVITGTLVWATPVVQAVGMGRAFAREPSPGCIRYCLKWETDENTPPGVNAPWAPARRVPPPLWTNNWTNLGDGQGNVLDCPDGSINDETAADELANRDALEFKVYGTAEDALWVAFPKDVEIAFLEDETQPWSGASKCGRGRNALTKTELAEGDDPFFADPNGDPYTRVLIPVCDNGRAISHIELIVDVCR